MRARAFFSLAMILAASYGAAFASEWSQWKTMPDGSADKIDCRYQISPLNYGGERLVDWQFRNRYPQRVLLGYEVTLVTEGGDVTERRQISLAPNEVGGNYKLGTGVRYARVRIRELTFGGEQ
jgi:hypothetical protein